LIGPTLMSSYVQNVKLPAMTRTKDNVVKGLPERTSWLGFTKVQRPSAAEEIAGTDDQHERIYPPGCQEFHEAESRAVVHPNF
jgi:hypothetical protein